jgi:hypothetical protein
MLSTRQVRASADAATSQSLRGRLRAAADEVRLIDTHEHLRREADRLAKPLDLFDWFHAYPTTDLVAAGLTPDELATIREKTRPHSSGASGTGR